MRSYRFAAFLFLSAAVAAACSSDADRGGSDAGAASDAAAAGDATGPGDASTVNPSPTISAYVGTNVSADLWAADLGYQLAAFSGTLDATGLPSSGHTGSSTTDAGFLFPSGAYTLVYEGTGAVTVFGIGKVRGAFTTDGTKHEATVDLVGEVGRFGQPLTITIANGAGQAVTSLHLYPPAVDATATFYPQFLAALAPFRALRFMDWEATNGNTLVHWADRPTSSRFGAQNGVPYELIAALINETGKDGWLTVPEKADDDFIAQLAQFFAKKLDYVRIQKARDAAGFTTPFRLYVENSNETWNGSFTARGTFLAAAKASPGTYTGTTRGTYGPDFMNQDPDLMRVGQYVADRLVKIGNAFKTAFGARADAIAPVLAGWALGPAYSDVGLQLIAKTYGDPKNYVAGVAQAPYFSPSNDDTTGSLTSLFGALTTAIDDMGGTFAAFANLGREYGIPIVAYEGGQGFAGETNLAVKHLAQHDVRMYSAYTRHLALWKKHFGTSLFMHFSLAGSPGIPEPFFQYGFWGSLEGVRLDLATCGTDLPTLTGAEAIASVATSCPKYRALAEQVPGN